MILINLPNYEDLIRGVVLLRDSIMILSTNFISSKHGPSSLHPFFFPQIHNFLKIH